MKTMKSIFTLYGFIGGVLMLPFEAKGTGCPGGVCFVSCITMKPSGAALKGTASVEVINYDGAIGDLDVTLRLRRAGGGEDQFFRLHLPEADIFSGEQVACDILDAGPVDDEGKSILEAFHLPTTKTLKILKKTIAEQAEEEQNKERRNWITRFDFQPIPGSDGNYSAIADITLYIVDADAE